MKKKSNSKSAFFNFRVLIGLFVVLAGVFLALLSFGFFSSAKAQSRKVDNANADAVAVAHAVTPVIAKSFDGDVRTLRPVPQKEDERDWEEKLILPDLPIGPASKTTQLPPAVPIVAVPMPTPIQNFEGLAMLDIVTGGQAGCGFPPDTNGEVGLNHYILAVNCRLCHLRQGNRHAGGGVHRELSLFRRPDRDALRHRLVWRPGGGLRPTG